MPLVASLESNLFWRMNSEPHKCVYCSPININMECFTWPKLSNIHLTHGAAYGSVREVQGVHREYFPNREHPDRCTSASVNCRLWETGTFAVNRHSARRGRSVCTLQFDEDVLQRFEKNPSTSTCLFGYTVSVDCLVWNIVHKQELYPFHRQKACAVLGPNDYLHRDLFVGLYTRVQRIPALPQCCSWMRPASPDRGFSLTVTAMFGQQQMLMLHLFTATNNALWSAIGRILLMTFWFGLTCYPNGSVHRFTLCFWRKSYEKCWRKSHCHSGETCGSSTTGLQLTLRVKSENVSPPVITIDGLDGAGQWLGLPGHWASHQ